MSMTPFEGADFSFCPSCPIPKTAERAPTFVKSAEMGRYCFIRRLERLIVSVLHFLHFSKLLHFFLPDPILWETQFHFYFPHAKPQGPNS